MTVNRKTNPITSEQWQEAIDLAHGALCLDSARQFGLVTGGPKINVERCQEILRLGEKGGYSPSSDAVEKFARALEKR